MKRAVLILAIVAGLVLGWRERTIPADAVAASTPTPAPMADEKYLELGNRKLGYSLWKVEESSRLVLVTNYERKQTFSQLVQDNNCTAGINTGFYDTSYRPLGWFVINGEMIRGVKKSALFDGFVYANEKIVIGRTKPDLARWGVQTGPIVWENSGSVVLKIKTDKFARRMVAGVDGVGKMVWMTVYDPESVFDGPKLADLPEVVAKIDRLENLNLSMAINLDGGTASAFYSPYKKLTEFNVVGSVWCDREKW